MSIRVRPVGLVDMDAFCRDCLNWTARGHDCVRCNSQRLLWHEELRQLSIAHVDCDAFYASVEKRDNPDLQRKPVIVGGGRRGVVSTACYVARRFGVHSAMPMFQARRLCPQAVVIRPRMKVYVRVSRQIREMMEAMTPLVEPLSLDEAFLDLSGTERLHGESPAAQLARLAREIENRAGVTVSIGLSHNKFLAKVASDLDKPRGFSIIGKAETMAFLADKPVSLIWGVGRETARALRGMGIRNLGDLREFNRDDLVRRTGTMGDRLWSLAHGEDSRRVTTSGPAKGLSRETTFPEDITDTFKLDGHLWRLSEQVSDRAKAKEISGRTVVLKVKKANHRILTRQKRLSGPTQSANRIYETARPLLDQVMENAPFRLIGVGIKNLCHDAVTEDLEVFQEDETAKKLKAERASDLIREKFGKRAILKGRSLL